MYKTKKRFNKETIQGFNKTIQELYKTIQGLYKIGNGLYKSIQGINKGCTRSKKVQQGDNIRVN